MLHNVRISGCEVHREPNARESVILIIDDDKTTRQMLTGILRRVGFQTATAVDGSDGIGMARSLRPDLILLDVHLPDIDGFDVCKQIQSSPGIVDTPILFISANEDVSVKVRGFESGGMDYITKPLAGREVVARVRTHLRLKQAYDKLACLQAERIERLAATQQMILPVPSSLPEARFAVSLKQIHGAGGDFYDVIRVGDLVVDYVVADASGHDLETSLWTAAMKVLLREHAGPLYDPADILQAINKSLCRVMPEGLFFTVLYARLNRRIGRLTLANGGHPPAVYLPKDGQPIAIRQTGDVLGVFPDADFETTELFLHEGDRFFLYTDGLVERKGNQEDGIAGLIGNCQARRNLSLTDMVKVLKADTQAQDAVTDDIVLMGVEV